jgi:hypothetical protein
MLVSESLNQDSHLGRSCLDELSDVSVKLSSKKGHRDQRRPRRSDP